MLSSVRAACRAACVLLVAFASPALEAAPRIPAYQRFHQDQEPTLAAGQLLLGELNCVACHATGTEWSGVVAGKEAPVLDQVGSRVRPDFVRAYLADPQKARPGSTMPDMLKGLTPDKRRQVIEELTHFLASTGELNDTPALPAQVAQGDRLFHEIGCTACHDAQGEQDGPLATSVVLPKMSDKYTIPSLARFLKDPLAIRHSGRMPHFNLNDQESNQLASYLLRDLQLPANTQFSYYEGNWQNLPDFSKLQAKLKGESFGLDLGVAARRDQFGVQFRATVVIPKSGKYKIHLGSDDGSRFLIDGEERIRVDGIHPLQFKAVELELSQGDHAVVVEFFEAGGGEELKLDIEGNGLGRQPLDQLFKTPKPATDTQKQEFVLDPELARRGAMQFASLRCNACHQLKDDRVPLIKRVALPPLDKLRLEQGCLATERDGQIPAYGLLPVQRRDLALAIARLQEGPPTESMPEDEVAETLMRFNCVACHQRNELGGVEEARNAFFQTNEKEMGDEARIPPLLTGVGSKLKKEWLAHVLDNGANDRPYMLTRMPRFTQKNVGPLADLLATHDTLEPLPAVAEKFSDRQLKAAGRRMVGSQGYSCIKCHTYGSHKATGVQSISLTTMQKRLQAEWFRQYVVKPVRFRPGTRMPSAWPQGQVLLADILDGTIDQQVHAVWTYLADADKGAVPMGLGPEPIELVATDHAIIYRNFIEGAGSRAIGVGYAEKANLAFDANEMSLSLLWHGAFMDASRHWKGRGQGYQGPLGDNVLRLESRPALAVLEGADAAWPSETAREQGYRFRGYRLVQGRKPIFRYQYRNVLVEDFINPLSDDDFTPVVRTLTLSSKDPVDNLWIRAIVAGTISKQDVGYQVDEDWLVGVDGDVGTPQVRKSQGRSEIILPVVWRKSPSGGFYATIKQLYRW